MAAFTIPSIFTAIDKFSGPVNKMTGLLGKFGEKGDTAAARVERSLRKVRTVSTDVAKKSFAFGATLAAPLILAATEAIKFEDRLADVGKTTGLQGKELQAFGKSILSMSGDTRTSVDDLVKIGEIGGQLGIAGKDLISFTEATDKFNVALGADFSGGIDEAARSIGGLNVLFKETRSIPVAESITKAGSAINALSAKGVLVPELTDFIKRIGQLPDAIKPSIQNTAALGAVLNKAGVTSEIGSRGIGDILLTASQNIPKFAQQIGLTENAVKNLLNNDPTAFLSKFAGSLNGLDAEKLSTSLKSLKIGDSGSIKVVGALASSLETLSEFQKISTNEFEKGTSILNEYETKNNTTAAQLDKAQNNFKALSIIIGTELLPIISDLLKHIMPIIKSAIQWAKENPTLVKTIVLITASLAALSFVVSGVTAVIALFASPVGLIVAGVVLLIAVIATIVTKWNEWGAALSFVLGPLGFVISLIQSFRRNWDMITKAFSEGGFLEGIKAIGKTILDAILMPIQQVLKLIAQLTGASWAQKAADGLESFRKELGVNVSTDENGNPLTKKPLINPEVSRKESLQRTESTQKQNVAIDINDNTGRAKVKSDNGFTPITLNSSMKFAR